jgi:glutathione S-transferase
MDRDGRADRPRRGARAPLGDRFTIADVIVGGVCFSARQYDVLPEAPNVTAYLERLDARPAKHRAFDDEP